MLKTNPVGFFCRWDMIVIVSKLINLSMIVITVCDLDPWGEITVHCERADIWINYAYIHYECGELINELITVKGKS